MIEFKFGDFFYPASLLRTWWLLLGSEHWGREQFDHYQRERLAAILRHCATDVPYYERLFKETGIDPAGVTPVNAREQLEALPILDKDALRDSPELFQARRMERFRPKAVQTSGTTGTPLTIYWDRGSNVMEFCSIQRLWRWGGFRVGQPFLDLRSRYFGEEAKHAVQENGILYIRNWKVNGLEFSSDRIDRGNVRTYFDVLERYRPRLVRGHPQAIHHLAALIAETGLHGWRPLVVTTASETLYPFQRRAIEDIWRVPVLDSYGLMEHNVFICQCRNGGYHVFPEYGICEILDDEGRPVPPGEEGRLIVTGLHNYAQPLLRYDTRDRALNGSGEVCQCGRTLPTIKGILGRIDDCVFSPDGRRYSGFSFAFYGCPGLIKARLTQDASDHVSVEVVSSNLFDAEARGSLIDRLVKKVDGRLRFELVDVGEIIQETPGKFKFVVSRIDPPHDPIDGT